MKFSKTMLFGALLGTSIAQATQGQFDAQYVKEQLKTFETTLLVPFINQAKVAFTAVDSFIATIATSQEYIYRSKKHALRQIKKQLKSAAKEAIKQDRCLGNEAQVLYKAFKHNVYKYWKKHQELPVVQ